MDRLKLLPCPFCGEPPREHYGEHSDEHWVACESESCDVCPTTSGGSRVSTRAAWNRRQSLSQEAVRDEALEVAAKLCEDYFDGPDEAWGARQIAYKLSAAIRALKREPNAAAQGAPKEHTAGMPTDTAPAAVAPIQFRTEDCPTYKDSVTPAAPDVAKFLEHWIADGHLQTFEDRQRFRNDAAALLAKLVQGWIPMDRTDVGVAWNGNRVWVCADSGALLRAKVIGEKLFVEFTPPTPGASDD